MRPYGIVYADAARADIHSIGENIRQAAGEAVAEQFVARIIATVESLEFMPKRHRIRSELSTNLRVIGLRKYLIFYKVGDEDVTIMRVLHGARNITALLFAD
jgi:toxin ParE1/3/4